MEIEKLKKYPIISKSDIKKILNCNDNYAYTVLNRLLKSKKIKKIIKGKYTLQEDIYLISTNLFFPSYLSFWSCSNFKGYTEQILNTLQIATTQNKKPIKHQNYKIEFKKLNKKEFFGYKKIKRGDSFMFIAEDEKLIIDSIQYENLMGNFDEIIKIVKNSNIKKEKIINYLKKINNKTLIKKTGFMLEKYKNIDISKEIKYKDKNIILLSNFMEGKKINKKWQVKNDI